MDKKKIYLYVGTFTRQAPYLEETNGEGIYVYQWDPEKVTLEYQSEIQGIDNPSYMCFDRKGEYLYANSEIFGWDEGLVKAYAVNPEDGSLSYINMQPSRGSLTSYISVDYDNKYALVTNYWTGSVVLFKLEGEGGLSQVVHKVQHSGTGPDPERQEGPHTHCVLMDPTNTFAFVADLGLDKIFCYRLDKDEGKLIYVGEGSLPPGTGPRHLIFHPSGEYIYVSGEMGAMVAVFKCDLASGALSFMESHSTIPEGFTDDSHCSDLHISANGRFLYVGNRGHDSIAVFQVNPDGSLVNQGFESTRGRTPRNFILSPDDRYLLAANQDSDGITIFSINQDSGALEYTGKSFDVPTPVCLKFLEL